MYDSGDPVKFVLDRNLKDAPGAEFYYNSGLTILLGEIVRHLSGLSIDDFSGQYLFSTLGITNYHWDKFANGRIRIFGLRIQRARFLKFKNVLVLAG